MSFTSSLTLLFARRIKRHRNTSNSEKAFTAKKQVLTPFVPVDQPLIRQVRMDFGGRHSLKHFSARPPQKSSPLASFKGPLELTSCVLRAEDGIRTRDCLLGRPGVTKSTLAYYEMA